MSCTPMFCESASGVFFLNLKQSRTVFSSLAEKWKTVLFASSFVDLVGIDHTIWSFYPLFAILIYSANIQYTQYISTVMHRQSGYCWLYQMDYVLDHFSTFWESWSSLLTTSFQNLPPPPRYGQKVLIRHHGSPCLYHHYTSTCLSPGIIV